MTVTTTTASQTFQGNGTATAFPCQFEIFQNTDVRVFFVNPITGTQSQALLNSDYTITGAGASNGFTVKTTTAVPEGTNLYVVRVLPYTQPTDFTNQGAFFPTLHQAAIDRLCLLIQQLANANGLSVSLPSGLYPQPSGVLPAPSPNDLIGWNALANGLQNVPIPDVGTGTFAPKWSGALTSRLVAAKLNDRASTADFGAVGDGVADDTAALQAALNSGAGWVEVVGTLKVTSTITLPSNCLLHLGPGGGIKWAGNSAGPVIQTDQTIRTYYSGIVCDGGLIDINGAAVGLYLHSAHFCLFDLQFADSTNSQVSTVVKFIADSTASGGGLIDNNNISEVFVRRLYHYGDCGTLLYLSGTPNSDAPLYAGTTLCTFGHIRSSGNCYISGIEFGSWCDSCSFFGMVSLDLAPGTSAVGIKIPDHSPGYATVYNHLFAAVNVAFYGASSSRTGIYLGSNTRGIMVDLLFIDSSNTSEVNAGTLVDGGASNYRVSTFTAVGNYNSMLVEHAAGRISYARNNVCAEPVAIAPGAVHTIYVPTDGCTLIYQEESVAFTGGAYVNCNLPGCSQLYGSSTYVAFGTGALSPGGGVANKLNINAGPSGTVYVANNTPFYVHMQFAVLAGLEFQPPA